MSVKAIRSKALPIGIDFGTHSLKMAQMRQLGTGEYELVAAGYAEVPESAKKDPSARTRFFGDALKHLLRSQPFKGRQCVLSLPAETTFVQHIKMAKMPADQLTSSLQWELQGKLPYDPSKAIIRYVVAGEVYSGDEVKQELIVLAAGRHVVESHLALARRVKLTCVGVNVEPCAIVECFARLFHGADAGQRATLFLDIGSASTQVVIGHGAKLAFAKNLFIGGSKFDQVIADGMHIPLADAQALRRGPSEGADAVAAQQLLAETLRDMCSELTHCVQYYESVFHNQPLERVVFLGGQAYDKYVCLHLAQHLALPAQIGDPLARVRRGAETNSQVSAAGEGSLPDWAVAVGLSLGAAAGPAAHAA